MRYCFLDTNIFLEFRPPSEITWIKELDSAEVCPVVYSVVARELDKHKTGNSNRRRKRARKRLASLEALDTSADNKIRDKVRLRFDLAEPSASTLADNHLSAKVPDDILIAKALEFKELDELFVIIDRPAELPATVEISYEVIAENVIDKISGKLTVIVNEVPSCSPSRPPASSI